MKFSKHVGRRSIKYFWDNKDAITSTHVPNNNLSTIPRRFKFSKLDALLIDWVDRIEGQGGFLTDILLKSKALSIYKEMSNDKNMEIKNEDADFKASNNWLYKFQRRHNISLKQCSGESYEVNRQIHCSFEQDIKAKILQYGQDNIFTCDETALFFKLAPSKSLVIRVRYGIKKYKDRITRMLACNMSVTEKQILLIVRKFKNPRSFKNFSKDFLCRYTHNKNAWMTSAVFNMWLFAINQK
ncbi:Tigger transposable element-derived protein 6 [Dictyocoela muelleri]|nr:Tigger transposable element-derived protein 6 [Dictyocoela muelleri]